MSLWLILLTSVPGYPAMGQKPAPAALGRCWIRDPPWEVYSSCHLGLDPHQQSVCLQLGFFLYRILFVSILQRVWWDLNNMLATNSLRNAIVTLQLVYTSCGWEWMLDKAICSIRHSLIGRRQIPFRWLLLTFPNLWTFRKTESSV